VLDFHKGSKPRNYLARHQQRHILLWVAVLAAPLVAGVVWASPGLWDWLWRAGRGTAPAVDTRLPARAPAASAPDTFRFPPPGGSREKAGQQDESGSAAEAIDWSRVRDDDLFRAAERDAWFSLFAILQQTDPTALRRQSVGRVTFIQLFRQSNEYRGKLVDLRGTLRRARLLPAPDNDLGIGEYYQLWLQPADNPRFPIVVYCLELPPGFPTGTAIEEDVQITGFFFKRWAYLATDTVRTAPVVLAGGVRWLPRPEPVATWEPSVRNMLWVILGAALFAAVVTWLVHDRTRRMGSHRPREAAGVAALADFDLPAESEPGQPPGGPGRQQQPEGR